ncbi:MAG: hypothetical protein JSW55_04355 [Chloroflexota bacterium]|nr:MAG: hypothetical protein JSW55_04355 [Chloroflexota bacterium]
MKYRLAAIVITLLVLVVLVSAVSYAQVSRYNSGFQVQNLSTSDTATIVIEFFDTSGSVVNTVNDTIAAGGINTYFPLPVAEGFSGSAVVSSDQNVAAVVNVLGDDVQGSSYTGFPGGSEVVSMPIINKENFGINTWFSVQNSGSANTSVTVEYSNQPSCNETASIAPGAAAVFHQAANTCLPAGYIGAATVTAAPGGSIVASGIQNAPAGLFAYNGFTSGSPSPVMPLVAANNYGFHTGIQIQNQGTVATNVTLSYTPVDVGAACTEQKTVQPGGAEVFMLYAFSLSGSTTSNCAFGSQFSGSAQVTGNSANQPLVAVINQTNFTTKGSAYNSFDAGNATPSVVMPIIMDAYNIWTGYNVLNAHTSASTTVTCKYSGLSSTYDDVATIGPGEAMNAVQLSSGFPANTGGGYVGSAICTSTGGVPILGVVNQANTHPSAAANDTTLTYEAFNN